MEFSRHEYWWFLFSHSVMSNSSQPHGRQPTRLLHLWDLSGKSTGVGCHCLLLDSILKSRDITLPTKVRLVKSYGFSSSHVWIWELDHKVSWALKNWCFQTMGLEKTPEIPWDSKEIKPVNPKENQPWIFIERTDAEAEAPILWPPDAKSQLIRKDLDSGKD